MIGATLISVLCAVYGRRFCEVAIRIWNDDIKSNWLISDVSISKDAALSGALIGSWSHLLMVSFMHYDIKPLSPFSDKNILLRTLSIEMLHSICVASGLIGLVAMFLLKSKLNFNAKANQKRLRM